MRTLEEIEELVRQALSDKAVIWDQGVATVRHPGGGCSTKPDNETFEGEIFKGELAGSHLIAFQVGPGNGSPIVLGSIIIPGTGRRGRPGQLQFSRPMGDLLWKHATGIMGRDGLA